MIVASADRVPVALGARNIYILNKMVSTDYVVKRSKPLNPQYNSRNPAVITTSSNKFEKDFGLDAVAWDVFKPEQPSSIGGMGPQLCPELPSEVLRFQRVAGRGL